MSTETQTETQTKTTMIPLIDDLLKSINNKDKVNMVCLIDDPACDKHELSLDDHQESSNRTKSIRDAINKFGLDNFIERLGPKSYEVSILNLAHSKAHIKYILSCIKVTQPFLLPPSFSHDLSMKDGESVNAILAAANSVIYAVDAVSSKSKISTEKKLYDSTVVKKVFCNVRPPGHHAHHNKGAGFCFMNNIAIGTKFAMNKYPETIKKVLIFDWDLHHGDGTEDIFKNDPNVLYASFHRGGKNSHDRFYPGTGESEDSGKDNIMNFPVPFDESTNVDKYMNRFFNKFLPTAYKFKPDLVMISAGFDSHKDDLYHALPLDYVHYHEMTKALMKLADECSDGRLVSVLEGGYTLDVLSKSVVAHIATLINGY